MRFPTWGDVKIEIVGTGALLLSNAFGQSITILLNDGVQWDSWGDDMNFDMVKDLFESVQTNKTPSVISEDVRGGTCCLSRF